MKVMQQYLHSRKLIQIFLLTIITLSVVAGLFMSRNKSGSTITSIPSSQPSVTIGQTTIPVEVVISSEAQRKGLGERDSLASASGMLFVFQEKTERVFWMDKMRFAIDIIYINGDRIISIVENAPPPKDGREQLPVYPSNGPADRVLEVNAGFAQAHGIRVGDVVTYNNL